MVIIHMRNYFSNYHIQAAALFAKQSAELEREHSDEPWEEVAGSGVFADHRAYVMGAIFSAVAFLEATVNELFIDVVDYESADSKPPPSDPPTLAQQLPPAARKKMLQMWPLGIEREFKTLGKFQAALTLTDKEQFNEGENPYQDCRDLIVLRNELMHYKPRLIQALIELNHETEKIAKRLRNKGFAPNRLVPAESGNPFFPHKCLSHGCAAWAVDASLRFADAFHSRMGITPKYEVHKPFDIGR